MSTPPSSNEPRGLKPENEKKKHNGNGVTDHNLEVMIEVIPALEITMAGDGASDEENALEVLDVFDSPQDGSNRNSQFTATATFSSCREQNVVLVPRPACINEPVQLQTPQRPPSNLRRRLTKEQRLAKIKKLYWQRSWAGFAFILVMMCAMEGIVGYFVYRAAAPIGELSPKHKITREARALEQMGKDLTTPNSTRTTSELKDQTLAFLAAVNDFNNGIPKLLGVGHNIIMLSIIPTAIHIIIIACVFVLFYVHRRERTLRTRGYPFLVHFVVATIFLMAASMYFTVGLFLGLPTGPLTISLANTAEAAASFKLLNRYNVSASCALICAGGSLLGALMQRQYIINQIFTNDTKLKKNLNYWRLFGLNFLFVGVPCVAYIVWGYIYDMDQTLMWAQNSIMFMVLGYTVVFTYFVLKTRHAFIMFSDFTANTRTVLWILVYVTIIMVVINNYPNSVMSVYMWAPFARMTASLTTLDMAVGLYIMKKLRISLNLIYMTSTVDYVGPTLRATQINHSVVA